MLVKSIFPFNIYLYVRYLAYMLNIPLNTYFKNKLYKIIIIYQFGQSYYTFVRVNKLNFEM